MTSPPLPVPLAATLIAAAGLMQDAADPWWVIASAAAALHGVCDPIPADVDLLTSVADAERLQSGLAIITPARDSNLRFRSAVFGRWDGAPLPVEIMAGLTVRTADGWQPVELDSRMPVDVGPATLWIPSRDELIAVLHRFGRPKDLARAAALAAV